MQGDTWSWDITPTILNNSAHNSKHCIFTDIFVREINKLTTISRWLKLVVGTCSGQILLWRRLRTFNFNWCRNCGFVLSKSCHLDIKILLTNQKKEVNDPSHWYNVFFFIQVLCTLKILLLSFKHSLKKLLKKTVVIFIHLMKMPDYFN